MAGTFSYTLARSMDSTAVNMPAVSDSITGTANIFIKEYTITNGGGEIEIDLAQIAATQTKMLIVTSDNYDIGASELIFKMSATGQAARDFDGPIILTQSIVPYLGVPTDKILITNTLTSGNDAVVRVELYYDPVT